MKEIRFYPYKMLGELVNADTERVIQMLKSMRILAVEDNPNTTCKYRKLCVDYDFRRLNRDDLYPRYFRERFVFKNGRQHFIFEISDEFVEFVKDKIEKEGCLYNVQFKQ